MDRTAPTFLPLDLNHVLGTAAARFQSTSGRLIRLPPTTGYFSAAGKVAVPSRRAVDGARIPFFKVEMTTALTPARRLGPFCDLFRDLPLLLKKPAAKPGHGPNKGEGK